MDGALKKNNKLSKIDLGIYYPDVNVRNTAITKLDLIRKK